MTQEYEVSHSDKGGFTLHLYKGSAFRNFIVSVVDTACAATFHRFCGGMTTPVYKWEDQKRIQITSFEIDRAQADALCRPGVWSYLDD